MSAPTLSKQEVVKPNYPLGHIDSRAPQTLQLESKSIAASLVQELENKSTLYTEKYSLEGKLTKLKDGLKNVALWILGIFTLFIPQIIAAIQKGVTERKLQKVEVEILKAGDRIKALQDQLKNAQAALKKAEEGLKKSKTTLKKATDVSSNAKRKASFAEDIYDNQQKKRARLETKLTAAQSKLEEAQKAKDLADNRQITIWRFHKGLSPISVANNEWIKAFANFYANLRNPENNNQSRNAIEAGQQIAQVQKELINAQAAVDKACQGTKRSYDDMAHAHGEEAEAAIDQASAEKRVKRAKIDLQVAQVEEENLHRAEAIDHEGSSDDSNDDDMPEFKGAYYGVPAESSDDSNDDDMPEFKGAYYGVPATNHSNLNALQAAREEATAGQVQLVAAGVNQAANACGVLPQQPIERGGDYQNQFPSLKEASNAPRAREEKLSHVRRRDWKPLDPRAFFSGGYKGNHRNNADLQENLDRLAYQITQEINELKSKINSDLNRQLHQDIDRFTTSGVGPSGNTNETEEGELDPQEERARIKRESAKIVNLNNTARRMRKLFENFSVKEAFNRLREQSTQVSDDDTPALQINGNRGVLDAESLTRGVNNSNLGSTRIIVRMPNKKSREEILADRKAIKEKYDLERSKRRKELEKAEASTKRAEAIIKKLPNKNGTDKAFIDSLNALIASGQLDPKCLDPSKVKSISKNKKEVANVDGNHRQFGNSAVSGAPQEEYSDDSDDSNDNDMPEFKGAYGVTATNHSNLNALQTAREKATGAALRAAEAASAAAVARAAREKATAVAVALRAEAIAAAEVARAAALRAAALRAVGSRPQAPQQFQSDDNSAANSPNLDGDRLALVPYGLSKLPENPINSGNYNWQNTYDIYNKFFHNPQKPFGLPFQGYQTQRPHLLMIEDLKKTPQVGISNTGHNEISSQDDGNEEGLPGLVATTRGHDTPSQQDETVPPQQPASNRLGGFMAALASRITSTIGSSTAAAAEAIRGAAASGISRLGREAEELYRVFNQLRDEDPEAAAYLVGDAAEVVLRIAGANSLGDGAAAAASTYAATQGPLLAAVAAATEASRSQVRQNEEAKAAEEAAAAQAAAAAAERDRYDRDVRRGADIITFQTEPTHQNAGRVVASVANSVFNGDLNPFRGK